jgi:hypothetical protein
MNSIAPLPSLHSVFEPIDQKTSPNLDSTKMLFTAPVRQAQPLTNLATAPSQSPSRLGGELNLSQTWHTRSPSSLGGGSLQE